MVEMALKHQHLLEERDILKREMKNILNFFKNRIETLRDEVDTRECMNNFFAVVLFNFKKPYYIPFPIMKYSCFKNNYTV